MKSLILYGRRNVGLLALTYLVAKFPKCELKVITDDEDMIWMCKRWGIELVTLETMGDFDLFFCVHGDKIIPTKYLKRGKMINVHPCLSWYKGHNPISKYIANENTKASVESQWLIEEVDAGAVIHCEEFETTPCKTYADFYNVAFKHYVICLEKTIEKLEQYESMLSDYVGG